MRKGFTLVECMLASAILGFAATMLFQGVGVFSRIAHENAQLLVAEAIAWDAAWKRFNESYANLVSGETTDWRNLSESAAPALCGYDTAPKVKVDVALTTSAGWRENMKVITADVEWGPAERRLRLSDAGHAVRICRGPLGRAP